ncbi:hypothetical protein R0137_11570 [Congregibacter brevis]|uniref:Uncharacterized protein n=1 Tax=Congregibacter brevis TaxID=3081201 RepID=A0ABZ0ICW9_9GAMM|nr:hypothetical protein R0137_11570 [Congregibacter sp. IMCC45268]
MSRALQLLSAFVVIGIAALAYFLTLDASQSDPCLNPQSDVSAAILAEESDQDALANRAMLQRTLCE